MSTGTDARTVSADTPAVVVPSGESITIPAGSQVQISYSASGTPADIQETMLRWVNLNPSTVQHRNWHLRLSGGQRTLQSWSKQHSRPQPTLTCFPLASPNLEQGFEVTLAEMFLWFSKALSTHLGKLSVEGI